MKIIKALFAGDIKTVESELKKAQKEIQKMLRRNEKWQVKRTKAFEKRVWPKGKPNNFEAILSRNTNNVTTSGCSGCGASNYDNGPGHACHACGFPL